MESMMYVVLYSGLQWLPHDLPERSLGPFTSQFFDSHVEDNGALVRGDAKQSNQYARSYTDRVVLRVEHLADG